MKKIILLFLICSPFCSFGQAKQNTKTNIAAQSHKAAPTSSCRDNAEGIHLTISGKDYDEEGVTNVAGNAVFNNVPAGDVVITRVGEDKSSPSCIFLLRCSDGACSRTGTFSDLTKGVSFRMSKPGTVTFSVK